MTGENISVEHALHLLVQARESKRQMLIAAHAGKVVEASLFQDLYKSQKERAWRVAYAAIGLTYQEYPKE